jgi:hypothetical protein
MSLTRFLYKRAATYPSSLRSTAEMIGHIVADSGEARKWKRSAFPKGSSAR